MSGHHVTLGNWNVQRRDAEVLRYEVFVKEQHVPVELEWDDMDMQSIHALVHDADGAVIGTGRLLPDGHIGRMAVKKTSRGCGIGSAILQALMDTARQRGDQSVVLHAQLHAAAFYERFGFQREGEEFMEAGIPHVQMRHAFS